MVAGLLKELAKTAGRAAVEKLVELITGKARAEPDEKPRGLSHKDVAHQQAQIRAATAHKVTSAGTVPPPDTRTQSGPKSSKS